MKERERCKGWQEAKRIIMGEKEAEMENGEEVNGGLHSRPATLKFTGLGHLYKDRNSEYREDNLTLSRNNNRNRTFFFFSFNFIIRHKTWQEQEARGRGKKMSYRRNDLY